VSQNKTLLYVMKFYVYALKGCPYSEEAVELLKSHPHLKNSVKWVERGSEAENLKRKHNHATFPQVFFDFKANKTDRRVMIGGCDKLKELLTVCDNLKHSNIPLSSVVYTTRMLQREK